MTLLKSTRNFSGSSYVVLVHEIRPKIYQWIKLEATRWILKFVNRSRRIMLKLRWSCWSPWGGLGGVNFFEYILKYLSYQHNFFLAQRTRLKTPFTYLEHDHMANRKFFRAFWKKFDLKKEGFIRNFQPNFCFIFEIIVYFTFPSI